MYTTTLILTSLLLHSCTPLLEFTQTANYKEYWSSEVESSRQVVSLWKPDTVPGYYLLGDTVVAGSDIPTRSALLVKPTSSRDLAVPLSSTRVWTNMGSASGVEVSIHRLSAPYGYRCLGMAVVKGFQTRPDLTKYRCVKKRYVVRGRVRKIWEDQMTSIYNRGHVDVIEVQSNDRAGGLNCQHFLVDMYWRHNFPVWVLSTRFLIPAVAEEQAVVSEEGLKVRKVGTWTSIWPESDVVIFSPSLDKRYPNYYSPGSYLVYKNQKAAHNAYLLSGKLGAVLDHPVNYTLVLADTSHIPLYLWDPVCRDSFFSLGLYATNHPTVPVNETVCVHQSFIATSRGSWNFARTDENWEDTLWEAGSISPNTLTVGSFTYTSTIYQPPTQYPVLLDKEKLELIQPQDQRATSYKLTRVNFHDDVSVFTSTRREGGGSKSQNPFRLSVTAKWTVDEDDTKSTPIEVLSRDIAGEPRRFSGAVEAAARKAQALNTYTTFHYTGTADRDSPDEDTGGSLLHETWLDLKFTALIFELDANEETMRYRSTTGILNMILSQESFD